MTDRIAAVIRKLYFEDNRDYFLKQCKITPRYLNELLQLVESLCSEVVIYNKGYDPCITIYCSYPEFHNGSFHVCFKNLLAISKVAKAFYFYHKFEVDNAIPGPDRMEPSLDGYGQMAYTQTQFAFEQAVVQFLEQQGLYCLSIAELEEAIPDLPMPAETIFGPQMTVENALFRDLYGFADCYTEDD